MREEAVLEDTAREETGEEEARDGPGKEAGDDSPTMTFGKLDPESGESPTMKFAKPVSLTAGGEELAADEEDRPRTGPWFTASASSADTLARVARALREDSPSRDARP